MLSYFTCDQIASDPDDPTNYYNDANYCDPEYDKLYKQQNVELDDDKRVEIVHQMLERQAKWGVYNTLYTEPDAQAYVKDRFTGFVQQPAEDRAGHLLEHLAELRAARAGQRLRRRRR